MGARRTVGLCWAALTLEGYDIVVFGAAVPFLLRYEPWGLDQRAVGLVGSVALLGMLVGALVSGVAADRRGRRSALVGGVLLVGGGMLLCAAASTSILFAVGRLLVGLGAGAMLPAASALLAESAPPGRRNLYQGLAFGGIGAGGLLSALAALALADSGSFRILFLLGALPSGVLIPALMRWLPDTALWAGTPTRPAQRTSWRQLLAADHAAQSVLFWVTTFLSLLVLFGAYTWLPVLMERSGYTLGSSLMFLLVLNAGVVVGSIAAPWAADRLGSRTMIFVAFAAAATAFALLAQRPIAVVAYILVAVLGAGAVNAQFLVNALIGASYPTALRATAVGAALGLGRCGGVVGPVYGSWLLADGAPVAAGFYGFAVPAVLAGLFSLALPTGRRTGT